MVPAPPPKSVASKVSPVAVPPKKKRLSNLFVSDGHKRQEAAKTTLSRMEDFIGQGDGLKTATLFLLSWSLPVAEGQPLNMVCGDAVGRTMKGAVWGIRVNAMKDKLDGLKQGSQFPIFRFPKMQVPSEQSTLQFASHKLWIKESRINVSDSRSEDPVFVAANVLDSTTILIPTVLPAITIEKQLKDSKAAVPLKNHVEAMMNTFRNTPSLPFRVFVLSNREVVQQRALYVIGDASGMAILSLPGNLPPLPVDDDADTVVHGVGFNYFYYELPPVWPGFDDSKPILIISHGTFSTYYTDLENSTPDDIAQSEKLYVDALMNDLVQPKAHRL